MNDGIFITGCSGYVGKAFLKRLLEINKDKRKIYCLVRGDYDVLSGVEYVHGDLLLPESYEGYLSKCSSVYHLAGYVKHMIGARQLLYEINYFGTKAILEASIKMNIKKFIYLGTAGVFHSSKSCDVCSERDSHTAKHTNYYCETKDAAHNLVASYMEQGLCAAIIMPVSIYSQDAPMVIELIDFLYKRKVFFRNLLKTKILLVSRDNVVNALIYSDRMLGDPEGFLLEDDEISLGEFIGVVEKGLSFKVWKTYIPNFLIYFVLSILQLYTAASGKEYYINKESYAFLKGKLIVESSKVRRLINMDKGRFRDSLNMMINNYKINLGNK